MPRIPAECPGCGRAYDAKESLIGRRVRCRICGHRFVLGPSSRPVEPPVAAPVAAPPNSSATAGPLAERIGRFRIDEVLGAGAFGPVYHAYDPTLDRHVSLKVTRREFQQDPKVVGRFLDMARRAARLTHPGIAPVYECGEEDGLCYVASAFIAGKPLSEIIPDGPLEPRRAARIAAEVAEALDHGHRQEIVHRDVRPSNILLDADDRPHLLDFGLSRFAGHGEKLTHLGTALGEVAYLAPEHLGVRRGDPHPAGDQYGLGAILYELLCGQVPFPGPLEVAIPRALEEPPTPPSRWHPGIPAELEAVCLKSLARRPEDRYPSCHDLADDLGRWLAGHPVTAPRPPAPGDHARTNPAATIGSLIRRGRRIGERSGPPAPRSTRAAGVPAACILVAAMIVLARGGRRPDDAAPRPAASAVGSPIPAVTDGPANPPTAGEAPPRPWSPSPAVTPALSPPTSMPPVPAPARDIAGRAPPRPPALGVPDPVDPGSDHPAAPAGSAVPRPGSGPTFRDLERDGAYFLLRAEYKVDGAVQRLTRPRKALDAELARRARDEAEWSRAPELRSELGARAADLELILRDYRQYVQQVEIKAAAIAERMLDDPFGMGEDNKGINWAGQATEEGRIQAFNSYLFSRLNALYPGWAVNVAKMQDRMMDLFRIQAQIARLAPESIEKSRQVSDRLIDSRRKSLSQLARTARGLAGQVQESYERLARAPEVRAKIAEANRGLRIPAALGPSDHFRRNVRVLEETEKLLASLRRTAPPAPGRDWTAERAGRPDRAPDPPSPAGPDNPRGSTGSDGRP